MSAVNASGIVSTVIAASLAVGAGGSGAGGGASVGAAIAKNSIGFSGNTRDAATANALVDDSSLTLAGDLKNVAVNNTRISATVVAASAAISGGGNGIGLAGAGASAENKVALDTTSTLSNVADGELTVHDVTVQSIDSAHIDSWLVPRRSVLQPQAVQLARLASVSDSQRTSLILKRSRPWMM